MVEKRKPVAGRKLAGRMQAASSKPPGECGPYRTMVDNSPDAIYLFQAGRVVFGNDALARLAGRRSASEVAGFSAKQILGLIIPADRPMVARMIREKLAGKKGREQYRFRVIRRDGSVGWLGLNSTRVVYKGRPALVGVMRDVSAAADREHRLGQLLVEKERAQRDLDQTVQDMRQSCQELVLARDELLKANKDLNKYKLDLERSLDERTNAILAERDKLHAVLEGMEEGIAIVNSERAVVFLNKSMKRLVGDVMGRKCFASLLCFKKPCADCPFKENPPGSTSTEVTLKNGRTYLVSRSAMQDFDGKWLLIHVFRDITERKKWEEQLKAVNRDLEWKNRQLEEFKEYTISRELELIRMREKIAELEKALAAPRAGKKQPAGKWRMKRRSG